ncbi:Pls/PosA family non-ribosomal peptide synthetase [Amycolatopsis dendrobii]|uniref:Peptide synthetase n=1 Tax=Amycolatopsis dendrobii TaxID=2760662 RepID=A0A7W3W364_9PSEU|nr:Pls/PosA family non-ribosomal peptide synthetase [Amycolatopsis dendrobii]MBB1157442.1 peptide synthetase [Amycolatopsis dendrobii]
MDITESPVVRPCSPDETGRAFAEVMAELTGRDQVPVGSDFFADLGANSLMMAQFCARVRKRPELPSVSMRDVYRTPTPAGLAAAVAEPAESPAPAAQQPSPGPAGPPRRASPLEYLGCGVLQALLFAAYSLLAAEILGVGADWLIAGSGLATCYLRSVAFGAAVLLVGGTVPIALKWILVGRWTPREIRLWSLGYVRFWLVKTLVQRNPLLPFFSGSPLYSLYLRALGARIGRGVTALSAFVPVCTDLLTIGEGTVICKDTYFTTYRAEGGVLRTGPVDIGAHAYLGEMSVLDIDTRIGDGAELGHASALHPGQTVPDGETWHGSPAVPADVRYRRVEPRSCGSVRRAWFAVRQLLFAVLVAIPLSLGVLYLLLVAAPQLSPGLGLGSAELDFTAAGFYGKALVVSAILFAGVRLLSFAVSVAVPRLLNPLLKPGETYRFYGPRHAAHRVIRRLSNARFFKDVFGDSAAIVHYLRSVGCKVSKAEQTGSNFGQQEKFENPFLFATGAGTMVADGLSVLNAEYTSTSFRLSQVRVGAKNFLGNHIAYPAGAKTGDNCLLATKVLVPLDGPLRSNVGLLGSPSFEIPRSVDRDSQLGHPETPAEFRRALAAKTRHNTVSMLMFVLYQWLFFFGLILLAWASKIYYAQLGAWLLALDVAGMTIYSVAYFVAVERIAVLVRPQRPISCSIYDRRFWRHERFWKAASATEHIQLLNGTPFKALAWRLLGAEVGRRLFDDGCFIAEKTLVRLGNDVTLNAGSVVQCHSQEDGGFKMDRIAIGSDCTVGVNALVHYGVKMGRGSSLAANSFLMKGEEVPENACWGGNPAHEVRAGIPGQRSFARRQDAGEADPPSMPDESADRDGPDVARPRPAASQGKTHVDQT